MPVSTRLRPLLHPVTAAAVLLLAGLLAGYAGAALLLVAVAGAAAGFANSGST
jgi:hypothetical protein